MARYIDADELIRLIGIDALCNKPYSKRDALACVKAINTADVVPRSEVEELNRAYLEYEETSGLKQAKTEIAREIFEEIEKIRSKEIHRCEVMRDKEIVPAERKYWEGGYNSLKQLSYWIAELKKKYTEEKKDENQN